MGEPIVAFRTAQGKPVVLADRCPHRLVPLSLGGVVGGDRLQCRYHGLEFGVDGRCVHNPHGNGAVPTALRAKSYAIEERHSIIWLWSGDRPADPTVIPDLGFVDRSDERYISKRDYLHVRANWRSILNNLMDLSHTSFLHTGILGDAQTAAAKVRVESGERFVTVHRDPIEAATPGLYIPLMPEPLPISMKWNVTTWRPPGVIVIDSGVFAPGGAKESGTGFLGMHLLTPETECSTHYMFGVVRWNPLNSPANDAEIMKGISEGGRFAFEHQDAPIIEAQQRIVGELSADVKPVLLASIDEGPVLVQRAIDRILQQQS
jgi:vanillate O-demethylase monooxygenase subunit